MGRPGVAVPADEHQPTLTPRQADVLRCVVRAYVRDGGPVSSAMVAAELRCGSSSATVRVELGHLTRLGLLDQPHVSAGRLPSAAGLRLFVDQLMHPRRPTQQARSAIEAALDGAEPAERLRAASRHLASTCTLTTIGRRPRLDDAIVERLEVMELSADRALAILVLGDGTVRHRMVPHPGSRALVLRARALFAERFSGWTLRRIRDALRAELAGDGRGPDAPLLALAARALPTGESADDAVIVEGRTHLLHRADDRDVSGLMRTLEEKRVLLDVLDGLAAVAGARVVLGDELPVAALHGLALVSAGYGLPGQPAGAVAVIGPVRMDYARVVPWVALTAEALSGHRSAPAVA
ncbi:MAG: heat-inducible transcription repressor HrcA [Myxococcales bacterium]|nr:heat-inducible transcription repressor HrcA [Myxococcales bacterium]